MPTVTGTKGADQRADQAGGPATDQPTGFDAGVASALLDVTGPIRRALRRSLRRSLPEGGLPAAQVELLGLVSRHPGIRVGEAACVLQLAANSVSTLVNQLDSAGLVRRQRDPADRRSILLRLTASGERVVAVRREYRQEVVSRALADIGAADRARIHAALPALRRLVERLEEEA